jgi:hypothetical protein
MQLTCYFVYNFCAYSIQLVLESILHFLARQLILISVKCNITIWQQENLELLSCSFETFWRLNWHSSRKVIQTAFVCWHQNDDRKEFRIQIGLFLIFNVFLNFSQARVLFNLQYLDDAIFLTRRSLEVQPPDQNAWQQHFQLGEILKV